MTQTLQSMRSIINIDQAKFETYSLQGKPQRDFSWCNLSYDESTGQGCFLIRFAPGGVSIPHEHLGYEEFLVLDGQVTECDGTIYKEGDFVSLKPGSKTLLGVRNGLHQPRDHPRRFQDTRRARGG